MIIMARNIFYQFIFVLYLGLNTTYTIYSMELGVKLDTLDSIQQEPNTCDKNTHDFPKDAILTIDEQENIYSTSFKSLKPSDTNPLKTIIPGLKPMARMYYSYVHQYVKDSSDHLKLLNQFWQDMAETIENDQLTSARMRAITMQLALLITNWQKGSLYRDDIEYNYDLYYQTLYADDKWKYIKNYNETELCRRNGPSEAALPYRWEAILCCPSGGISYKRFVKAYLEHNEMMHIAVLALENEVAHGGIFGQSADYLDHDFRHIDIFNDEVKDYEDELENPEPFGSCSNISSGYLDRLRTLLKKVPLNKGHAGLNTIALFQMLHEALPSLIDDNISYLNLPETEELPPVNSSRNLFLRAIANSAVYKQYSKGKCVFLENVRTSLPDCMKNMQNQRPWRSTEFGTSAMYESLTQNANNNFTGRLAIINEFDDKSDDEEETIVGSFLVTFKILSTDDPLIEDYQILKADDLTWMPNNDMSLEEKEIISNDIALWSYTRRLSSLLAGYFKGGASDHEKMLRSLYKENSGLPPVGSSVLELLPAIEMEMKRFWRDFYLTPIQV